LTFLTLLILGCSTRQSDKPQIESTKKSEAVSENDNWSANTFFITDTSNGKKPFVKLTTIDKQGTYRIEWGQETKKWSGNLMTLTDSLGYRMPPTVLWSNEKWICLMTNHSGPFSQHLFLPLTEKTDPIFYAEDIEYTDSTDNFICFINSNSDSTQQSVVWTIQSLMTDKRESFQLQIDEHCIGYPWYRNIYRKGDYLIIEYSKDEVKKINISNYCT
jgi:hypothetical protein